MVPGSVVLVITLSVVALVVGSLTVGITSLVGGADVVCSSGNTGFLSCGIGRVTIILSSGQQTIGSLLSKPQVIGLILLLRARKAKGHREMCVQKPRKCLGNLHGSPVK